MYDVVVVGYGPTGMLAAVKLGRPATRLRSSSATSRSICCHGSASCTTTCCACFRKSALSRRSSRRRISCRRTKWPTREKSCSRTACSRKRRTAGRSSSRSINRRSKLSSTLWRKACRTSNVARLHGVRDRAGQRKGHRHGRGRERRSAPIEARYAIGADGGNSFVRGALGLEFEFLGFDQDWLVIDAKMKRSPRPDLPALRQFCEPDQPGMTMQMGAHHRRWSFMIFPDEPA